MRQKLLIAALAAMGTAMIIFPAMAAATPNHIEGPVPLGFTIHSPANALSTSSGSTITCNTLTGVGTYTTTTSGTLNLTGDHCATTVLGSTVTCTSTNPAEVAGSGNVSTTTLGFHLITIDGGGNGILIKPGGAGVFAHFQCAGIKQTIEGNGFIGTETAPACNVSSNTATTAFEVISHGQQRHGSYTGTVYRLTKGGENAALGAHATITYNGGASRKLICT